MDEEEKISHGPHPIDFGFRHTGGCLLERSTVMAFYFIIKRRPLGGK